MTEQTKVTVPADVARAIELALGNRCGDKSKILRAHVGTSAWRGEYAPLNKIDMLTLATALINGYEIEESPEEKLREYYDKACSKSRRMCIGVSVSSNSDFYIDGIVDGVQKSLSILGIKIEGINA